MALAQPSLECLKAGGWGDERKRDEGSSGEEGSGGSKFLVGGEKNPCRS